MLKIQLKKKTNKMELYKLLQMNKNKHISNNKVKLIK